MKNRVSVALNRGRMIHGKRVPAGTVPGGDAPVVTAFSMTGVTETSISMTWTCDQYVTGQLRYGTTPTQLNQTTLKETSFAYLTHIQTITGLSASTDYYIQAYGENAAGDGYASGVILIKTQGAVVIPPGEDPPTYDPITYTSSVTLPGFYGGYTIDHTGQNDSTPGVQAWIVANAGGTDATHHKRLIFPATSTIKINTGICLGGANMSYTTLWGHAATSSAWIRGDAGSYLDVGCKIVPALSSYHPHHSAFIYGSVYRDYESLFWDQGGEGFIVRGFDIMGPSPQPGIFLSTYENQNALEYGTVKASQFCYNRVRATTGDLVRFRSGSTGRVHHNYVLNTGRMGISVTTNYGLSLRTRSDHVVEYNTIDRCGYWGIDVEPEDAPAGQRIFDGIVIRNNRWGSFGDGFVVIGGTAVPDPARHLADVEISSNILDGYGYGNYSVVGSRSMYMLLAHTANLSGVTVGTDPRPQRITFRDNVVTHGAAYTGPFASPLTARYTDTLVVQNNDANFGGTAAAWINDTGCTGINESGNT